MGGGGVGNVKVQHAMWRGFEPADFYIVYLYIPISSCTLAVVILIKGTHAFIHTERQSGELRHAAIQRNNITRPNASK